MPGMIAGMLKQRLNKYQNIVKDLLAKQDLSNDQKDFLVKEKIINEN